MLFSKEIHFFLAQRPLVSHQIIELRFSSVSDLKTLSILPTGDGRIAMGQKSRASDVSPGLSDLYYVTIAIWQCRSCGGMVPCPRERQNFLNDLKERGTGKNVYQDFSGAFGGISSVNAMIKPITARTAT